MAGGRIRGITIEIDGNTSKLNEALKNVDKQLYKTQTNLKDVNKLLKLDPGNVELLRQKQKNLTKAIEDTKGRLTELKDAQKQVTKGSDEWDDLQREIIATEQDLEKLESEYKSFGSVAAQQVKVVGEKMQSIGNGMKDVGKNLTTHLTVPIVTAFAASTKSAIDWETSFTGVMKTVDETATTTYADIEEGLKDLSTQTASSKGEIAAVAEVAGQLGISADNILEFTKTMIELGDTTNISAEEAATALARFINITGESTDNVDALGSVIVELGNNFATDEASIVSMSTRLAAAGRIAGLSSQDILALAASMSSVGIEAEAGGTAMSQTLTTISQAVMEGSEDMETFASVAGMTSSDFAAAWQNDPVTALQAFIGGLGEMNAEGEDTYSLLEDLGISGIRQSNMLQSLSLASDLLTDATGRANAAFEENTALQDEASKRYDTTASKMSQTKERLTNIAIEIGERLLPYVDKFLDFVDRLMAKWDELDPKTQDIIITIAGVAAAIGPVLVVLGSLIAGIGKIIVFAPIVGAAIAAIGAPVAGVAVAIGAIIAAGAALISHWDIVCQFAEQLKSDVTQQWEEIKTKCSTFASQTAQTVQTNWNAMKNGVTTAASTIYNTVTSKFQSAKTSAVSAFEGLRSGITGKLESAKSSISGMVDKIKGFFSGLSLKIPEIQLPHLPRIRLTTGSKTIFGKTFTYPTGFEFYAKAMKDAYLLDGPTVFGMNGGRAMVGGEAGKEVILGLDKLKQFAGSTVVNVNMTVNGAKGQDVNVLADRVAARIYQQVRRAGA